MGGDLGLDGMKPGGPHAPTPHPPSRAGNTATRPRRKVTRNVPPLTIDPARQFGRVCLNGTRITAENVAGCVYAGDSVDSVADDYGVTREEVLLACWWFVSYGEIGTTRTKQARQWRRWAEHAQRVLGGWDKGVKLCDPDEYEETT